MKKKVEKAIINMRKNPWEKTHKNTKCPLMCWDVTSMVAKTNEAGSAKSKKG